MTNHFTMFSLPSCPYCDKAKDLLYANLSEEELRCLWIIDINEQPGMAAHLKSIGLNTVPQVFVKGSDEGARDERIGGFSELEEWFAEKEAAMAKLQEVYAKGRAIREGVDDA